MSPPDTISLDELAAKHLADPEVKAAYDAMANEFGVAKALIAARSAAKLSQKDVAERMRTSQSAIARMESGRQSVSTGSIQKYATAVGRPITIEIRPLPSVAQARAAS
ncbi:helix-turn-helix domain-containing protein [Jiella sonneratiae]|uniref:Helix-turn-helix transcriptional regulator n=1 Tax=Jiella sonneratiae TaxID=2816856 RepID=A0ABS3J0J3_9HYPH|nr:helix-turn-helix transcriptional regulator [Jiella sonneratiae]MBO0903183.1 helix-turn-helix transcriptional regulator [Jiella sonneratiae]